MTKNILLLALAAAAWCGSSIVVAQEQRAALEGLDPVLLIQGKEEPGKPEFSAQHGRFLYVFASAASRDEFQKDPERWGIQLGGACARMGDPVRGNADSYYVHEGRIYIFGSDACYRMFKETPARFLATPVVWKPQAAALQKGAARLREIRAAMGIDGITGWTEKRRMGQSERVTTAKIHPLSIDSDISNPRFRFRVSVRGDQVEQSSPTQGMTNKLTGGAAKATSAGFLRDPLWLVSGALEAVPSSTSNGAVDIYTGLEIVSLLVDAASKRPLAAIWRGRGADGAFADIRAAFTDFRDVEGGGSVPFHAEFEADGKPAPQLSWTLDSVELLRTKSASAAAPANAWNQWGGPHRDFHVDADVEPWSGDHLRQVWTRKLGDGYSGVVLAADSGGGLLYTMFRDGGDQEVVVAASAATGETAWEQRYAAPLFKGFEAEQGPGPRATPLLDDGEGLLFTAGSTGIVHAFDAKTGKLAWQLDLAKAFGAEVRARGYSVSPVAYRDSIIVLAGGPGSSVVRLRKRDGSVVWKSRDEQPAYASPFLMKAPGRDAPVLVTLMAREILGLDPETGALLWSHAHSNSELVNASTPVAGEDGVVFLSSAYDGGCRAIRVSENGKVTELWSHRLMRIHHANAVRSGNVVYGSSGDFGPSPFTAVDVLTGKVLWRERSLGRSNILAIARNRMLMLDEDGNLVLVEPADSGVKILAKAHVSDGLSWTAPTLAGHRLYVRNRTSLTAYDLQTAASSGR